MLILPGVSSSSMCFYSLSHIDHLDLVNRQPTARNVRGPQQQGGWNHTTFL